MKLTEENEIAFEIMHKNKVGSSPLAVKICGGEGKLVESAFQRELQEINSEVTKAVKSNLTENWFGFANYSGLPNKVEAKEEVKAEEEPAYLKDKSHRNVKPKEEDLLADLMGHKIGNPMTGATKYLYQKAMAYIQKGYKATDALKKAKGEVSESMKEDKGSWQYFDNKQQAKKAVKEWLKDYTSGKPQKVEVDTDDDLKISSGSKTVSVVNMGDKWATSDLSSKHFIIPKKESKVESLINLMLDKSLMLAETTNTEARKVAYFLSERFIPTLETLVEAKEDDEMEPMDKGDKEEKGEKEEKELSPEEAKKVLAKVQKGLETLLGKVTDEEIQKDIQKYIDTVEDILDPDEDEEEGEKESEEPKEIEEAKEDSNRINVSVLIDMKSDIEMMLRDMEKALARAKKDDAFNHELNQELGKVSKSAMAVSNAIERIRKAQSPMFKPDFMQKKDKE